MSPDLTDSGETERDRQELVREFSEGDGLDDPGENKPGSFGCHELLDRTALIMRLLEEQVVEHPACFHRADWFALAHEATAILNRLYQEIGREHLGGEIPDTPPQQRD